MKTEPFTRSTPTSAQGLPRTLRHWIRLLRSRIEYRLTHSTAVVAKRIRLLAIGLAALTIALAAMAVSGYLILACAVTGLTLILPHWVALLVVALVLSSLGTLSAALGATIIRRSRR